MVGEAHTPGPHRVLVVDDNDSVRRGLMKVLARAGFEVRGAADGVDALAEVNHSDFSAITCDMMMPRLDGMGFYRRLKESHPNLAVRVLFVTAWGDEPIVAEFAHEHGRPVLQKPFEAEDFVSAVLALVE
jgi:CheY-like chemotaxis protein